MLASHVVRFGVFELDPRSGELRRHGLKIRLPDQSFQILKLLLSRPGEVVTREELRGVLWSSQTFVDFEVGLNSAVRKLREALDDSADNPRFVETLPRRGYRFVASVSGPVAEFVSADVLASRPPPAAAAVDARRGLADQRTLRRLAAGTAARARSPAGVACHRTAAPRLIAIATAAAFERWGLAGVGAKPAPIGSLVVLPFENLTGDPAQD